MKKIIFLSALLLVGAGCASAPSLVTPTTNQGSLRQPAPAPTPTQKPNVPAEAAKVPLPY